MSVSLFDAVPAGSPSGSARAAIEVLTDAKGAPYFKCADLGRFLGIANVKRTYQNIETTLRELLCIASKSP